MFPGRQMMDNMHSIGRIKIFTDQKKITRDNILSVLQKSYAKHRLNVADMQFLIDYEAGFQPLKFQKTVRPEVDIRTTDNMANYVTEFKKGYFWGSPIIYTQRGNQEHHNTDTDIDSAGISALNEMLLNGSCIGRENQKLADFVEKVGIGHRFISPKTDWLDESTKGTYADIYTLDSRYAYCVYYSGIGQKKVLGVTYSKISGKIHYTCFTDSTIFDVVGNTVDEYPNLLGMIPIVVYERSVDRTGCFERQIPLMDHLNILLSSFANDTVQRTMEIWWGNDIKFPVDENGNAIKPKSGQWVLTYTGGEGNNPKIQPMSSSFTSDPTLSAIDSDRSEILKRCFVPMQYSSEGGGSTGVATDAMSGWNATAVDADRQEQLISGAAREELILILKSIELASSDRLSRDDPLRKIHSTDIDLKFTRRQNWDLSTKANAFGTLISHGVNGRHALKVTNMFDDVEQVYIDSKEGIDEYQKNAYGSQETKNQDMQDSSDQLTQSPAIDGLNTARAQAVS